jgi:hypothetical protein
VVGETGIPGDGDAERQMLVEIEIAQRPCCYGWGGGRAGPGMIIMSWVLGLIVFHVKTRLESRPAKLGLHCPDIFGPADANRSCRISR